jgi:chemotaxis protein MotB
MQHGVNPARMTVVGLGEHHPLADNATVEGRNRNRRVVIVVLGQSGGASAQADAAAAEGIGAVIVPAGTLKTLTEDQS